MLVGELGNLATVLVSSSASKLCLEAERVILVETTINVQSLCHLGVFIHDGMLAEIADCVPKQLSLLVFIL